MTWKEGMLTTLALTSLIEKIEADPNFRSSPYWKWNLEASKEFLERLKNYQWEV